MHRSSTLLKQSNSSRPTPPASANGSFVVFQKKGPPLGGPQDQLKISSRSTRASLRLPSIDGAEHQRTGRIGERTLDIERSAGAIGLLQGPVAHVQLQPEQHTLIRGLQACEAEGI